MAATNRKMSFQLNQLEQRDVPSAFNFGTGWSDSENLTFSYAKDNTEIGVMKSSMEKLFSNIHGGKDAWQAEIMRAFQAWSAVTNVNFGLVSDSGQAFGTPGEFQGDVRFGDIRFGATAMSNELATSSAVEWSNGTWAGDILFNSSLKFGINPPANSGIYDIYTVALHEIGHTLGLGHSSDPLSVMSERYLGTRTGLSQTDITEVQSIHDVRSIDDYEATIRNDTLATATFLNGSGNITVTGDLSTTDSVDYYRIVVPNDVKKFSVHLQTTGLSLLTSSLTLQDATGKTLDMDYTLDPTQGDLDVKVSKAAANGIYYIRIASTESSGFGIGRYQLQVVYQNEAVKKDTFTKDNGNNETASAAIQLQPDKISSSGRNSARNKPAFSYDGVIENKSDVDYYRITASASLNADQSTLFVQLRMMNQKSSLPIFSILDENNKPLAYQILTSRDGAISLQIQNVRRGASYLIRVMADGTDQSKGNYTLNAEFTKSQDDNPLAGLFSAGVTRENNVVASSLNMITSGLFQFRIDTDSPGRSRVGDLVLEVLDSKGKVLFSMTTEGTKGTVTGGVHLAAGMYHVRITAQISNKTETMGFYLSGGVTSDPMGPIATTTSSALLPPDPTSTPTSQPLSPSSTTTVPPTTTNSTTTVPPTTTNSTPPPVYIFTPLPQNLVFIVPYSY